MQESLGRIAQDINTLNSFFSKKVYFKMRLLCMHTYIHTYIKENTFTQCARVHTYIHTYIYVCIYRLVRTLRPTTWRF